MLCSYQVDNIFKKLNSLSFPWIFQDILNLFPEQLKREKFHEGIFVGDHGTYFSFSFSFPGLYTKVQISLSYPWDSDNFSNFLSFPGFPCFPGLWPPCLINRARGPYEEIFVLKSQLIRALLYTYTNKIAYSEIYWVKVSFTVLLRCRFVCLCTDCLSANQIEEFVLYINEHTIRKAY